MSKNTASIMSSICAISGGLGGLMMIFDQSLSVENRGLGVINGTLLLIAAGVFAIAANVARKDEL